jgi:molecular chaperone HscA
MPFIRQRLADIFGLDKINCSLNPDEVVALGAAVEADILAGKRKDILLLDVTPLSLGIETLGGLMDVIIPRNSKVPARAARQYTTSVDGQANMKISVYQGERELVSENRKLAEFTLKGIPAMPAGLPKIEVGFLINADGILKVTANEVRSGLKQEIEIQPGYGLTDEQVEKMLLDGFMNAGTDVAARMLQEAKTEATQLIYTVQRFIEKNAEMLSEAEKTETLSLTEALKQTVTTNDKDTILGATDRLNEFTRPFAERLMDEAVAKALKGNKIGEL